MIDIYSYGERVASVSLGNWSKSQTNLASLPTLLVDLVPYLKSVKWSIYSDIDGCLYQGSLYGPSRDRKTVEIFYSKKSRAAKKLHGAIQSLREKEISFNLISGREFYTAFLIAKKVIPKSFQSLDLICEGGAIIFSYQGYTKNIIEEPKACDFDSLVTAGEAALSQFEASRENLDKVAKELGGKFVENREIILSYQFGTEPDMKNLLTRFLESLPDQTKQAISCSYSSRTLDIVPNGVSKVAALMGIVEETDSVIAIVDSNNDEGFAVACPVVLVPANGLDSIKEIAKNAKVGFISTGQHIYGVAEMLKLLSLLLEE